MAMIHARREAERRTWRREMVMANPAARKRLAEVEAEEIVPQRKLRVVGRGRWMDGIELRDEMEIQRAHDILEALLLGELDVPISDETRIGIHIARSTLCWVLRHDEISEFANNLAQIEKAIADAGYVLKHRGQNW
jgi:hypothetical protein